MQSFGFESDVEDGEEILAISEALARNPALVAVRDLLESALPAAAATVLPTPGVPVFPDFGAMGAMGGSPHPHPYPRARPAGLCLAESKGHEG
jgi:hypothetical protein